uniref:Activin_recp domain-containing protein n=1 Tax=Elaeophora elaphi TaxID=1147741 RepID=A0A0R3RI35_9BILA
MIGIVLVTSLTLCLLQIEMVLATSCYFSRPSKASLTGWVDLIDECKEEGTNAVCFSGYNPRVAYFHEIVGWWRLRKKLACSSDEEVPKEGCYRDKAHYMNFFLCWCTGSKCNTRRKITEIYKRNNTTYVAGGGCEPF